MGERKRKVPIQTKPTKYSKLFNPEVAERFLNNWCQMPSTEKSYRLILLKTAQKEFDLKKNVYDFNVEEFSDLLRSFNAKSEASLDITLTILRRYIEWSIQEGYTNKIPVTKFFNKDDLHLYIHKVAEEQRYILDREELFIMCDNALNAQDAVCLALAFEGVKGEKNSELTNLKISDFDETRNELYIKDNLGVIIRTLKVDNRTIELIKRALKQTVYLKDCDPATTNAPEIDIVESEYIIRIGNNIVTNDVRAGYQTPYYRISRLGKICGKNFLTVNTVFQSGMIVRLKELEQQKGSLTMEDYKETASYFGINSFANVKHLYEKFMK